MIPLAVGATEIVGVALTTVNARVAVPVPPVLVALIVTLKGLPIVVVGVPVMAPVAESSESPAGRPVAL